jgi:uncharacterized protein YlzI (FlbEa/FlbD family)
MNSHFIELTEKDGSKILLNALHIGWIESNKTGSTITFNLVNYSFPKKVQESYETVKSLIG